MCEKRKPDLFLKQVIASSYGSFESGKFPSQPHGVDEYIFILENTS